jgi:hypothetical protein
MAKPTPQQLAVLRWIATLGHVASVREPARFIRGRSDVERWYAPTNLEFEGIRDITGIIWTLKRHGRVKLCRADRPSFPFPSRRPRYERVAIITPVGLLCLNGL